MHKSKVDDVFHWSLVGNEFKAYYASDYTIYEIKVFTSKGIEIDKGVYNVNKFIERNIKKSKIISLSELLNIDLLIIGTPYFKTRIEPYIRNMRNQKINIINGN